MSQPGTLGNAIPRDTDDWVARELADLRRLLRRALVGSASGVVTGTQGDETATSITATTPGSGTSIAVLPDDIAIGDQAETLEGGSGGNIAIGYQAQAGYLGGAGPGHGHDGAVAIGDSALANQSNAIAIGPDAAASDLEAIAIGTSAEASAEDATTVGASSVATAQRATAIGVNAAADGQSSFAAGDLAGSATDYSVAIGEQAQVTDASPTTNFGGVAVGATAHSQGKTPTALGYGTRALADGAVAIGADHTGGAAASTGTDEFVLGTANHIVIINGKLVMADDVTGDLYHVVLSGGALSFVAYP